MERINIFLFACVISGHKFSVKLIFNLQNYYAYLTTRINSLSKLEIDIFILRYNFLNNEYSNVGRQANVGNCKESLRLIHCEDDSR